jgi:hypothetical protein
MKSDGNLISSRRIEQSPSELVSDFPHAECEPAAIRDHSFAEAARYVCVGHARERYSSPDTPSRVSHLVAR